MNRFQSFQEFLATQSVQIPIPGFIFNLIIAAVLSYLLSLIYIKYGSSLSNRRSMARNFILITTTTTLIIAIVKSSLALSLGLVGALSIVRFRAAIKEPEELVYLFLAISIGLGFGANQGVVTTLAFVIISGMVVLTNLNKKPDDYQNLHLSVSCEGGPKLELNHVVKIINENCSKVLLKRFDDHQNMFQAIFLVEIDTIEELEKIKNKLQETNVTARITYMENKGIF